MLHNLWPEARRDLDHLRHRLHPRHARRRRPTSSRPARSGWTCRTAASTRCSTCSRARATDGRYTYPDDADDPYGDGPPKNRWTVDRPTASCIATGGHLHPGGLQTDLWRRAGRRDGGPEVTAEGRARRHRPPVHVGGRSTTSPPARCRGTCRCPSPPPDCRRRAEEGRRARRPPPPTTASGPRGTSRWGSWSSWIGRRRPTATTRSPRRST